MRQILSWVLMLFVWTVSLGAADVFAAKNSSEGKKQQVVEVEEEQGKNKKSAGKKELLCGTSEHPIRVAGFVTNAPFGWVNIIPATKTRPIRYQSDGFASDLFREMAENSDLTVQNVGYKSYQEALRDLRMGKLDVLAGGYMDKRMMGEGVTMMFPGYWSNPIIAIFPKGKEKNVQSWADLRGMKGVVRQEENIYSLVYNQLPKDLEIRQVSGAKKALTALINGDVDYMLTSLYAGEAEVRRFKLIDDISFHPVALERAELFFVFSSHSPCHQLKKKLGDELRKIQADDQAYQARLVSYIDAWGERFWDTEGLKEMLSAAQKNESDEVALESVESADDPVAADASDAPNQPQDVKEAAAPVPAVKAGNPAKPLTAAERIKNL